ncbi:MAG: HAD-IC family P-type ATPase, partial [Gemmatimonadaceae bacterium]
MHRAPSILPLKPPAWHTRSVPDVARALQLDVKQGLSAADAATRLARNGPNALPPARSPSIVRRILHQFQSLIVALLVVAGVVALVMGDTLEATAILFVIALDAIIGFATEWKAASAIARLRRQTVSVAIVRRDAAERQVHDAALVAGDVVLLAAGDRVPADGRLFEDVRLQIDESALTGESLPVEKSSGEIAGDDLPLGDRTCMVYMGTAVTDGRGAFIVTATGARTEMGEIGALIEGVADKPTPLEAKLTELSRALLVVVLLMCVAIIGMGMWRGHPLLFMVEVGISLAIAAVPEGLLAVTTMTLAIGMQRMARMHALVRRLPAVESLGATTVICTDKTGTLTRNEMTVRALVVGTRRVDVTGVGYAAPGQLEEHGTRLELATDDPANASLRLALRIGALCNDASINRPGVQPAILGDPTEAALIIASTKSGMDHNALEREFPRHAERPFDSVTKQMATVHRAPDGRLIAFVKGAPSTLLDESTHVIDGGSLTPMTAELRQGRRATNDALAGEALRVLALAYRDLPEEYLPEDLTRELTFVGFVAMMDPLRDEAKATIARCRAAGIRTIMITGDQQATASEIARQLGLDVDVSGRSLRTLHARDLAGLDATGWSAAVTSTAVFARVSPRHKLQIVEALQLQGEVVAMTGDGVNDAPALRKADIGIAMGIRGTEVAKESAAMIITDDNFATIVRAVEQGRIIVENILRFLHYLFSSNFAEILTVFSAIMLGWPLPL